MGIKTISGQMAIPVEDEVKLGVDKSKSTTVSKISSNVGEQTETQLAEFKEELLSTVSKISSNVGEQTETQLAEFKEELLSTVSKISSNIGEQTEAQLAELKEELLSTVSKISSNIGEQTEAQLAELKEELLSTVSKISSNIGEQTEAQLAEFKEELLSTVSNVIEYNEEILNKLNVLYERFNVFVLKQEIHNSICSKDINEISNNIKHISENTEAAIADVNKNICSSDNNLHLENENPLLSAANIYIYISAAIGGALGALLANAIMF